MSRGRDGIVAGVAGVGDGAVVAAPGDGPALHSHAHILPVHHHVGILLFLADAVGRRGEGRGGGGRDLDRDCVRRRRLTAAENPLAPLRHHGHSDSAGHKQQKQRQQRLASLPQGTVQALVDNLAAEAHNRGYLLRAIAFDVKAHQLLLSGAEGRHQVLHLLLLRQQVVGSHRVGHHGRQRQQRGTFLAPLQVEHRTCPPADPGLLLLEHRVGPQLVEVDPQRDGDLLQQVLAAAPIATGRLPAQGPHHPPVALQQFGICTMTAHTLTNTPPTP